MSRHYRILQKAKLAGALFGEEADADARRQEEADRLWPGGDMNLLEAPPSVEAADPDARRLDEAEPEIAVEHEPTPVEAAPVETAPVEPEPEPVALEPAAVVDAEPDWTALLGDALGVERPTGDRRLLLCPATSETRVTSLLAGLAEWALQNGARDVVAVEANWRSQRLAKALGVSSRGLDRLSADRDATLDEMVHSTDIAGLAALPAGRRASSLRVALERYGEWVPRLAERFDTLVVETPAADDPALRRFPFAAHGGAVLLVVDPQLTRAGQIRKAVERLAALGAPCAGVLLSRRRAMEASARIRRVARHLGA